MIIMTRKLVFSAALSDWSPGLTPEQNRAIYGASANPEPYGHNYTLEVAVGGEIDPKTGILVNIREIDRIVRERVISLLDHKYLNGLDTFRSGPVTAESLTEFIRVQLEGSLPAEATLIRLKLEESERGAVTWEAGELKRKVTGMQHTRVYEFAASHRLHSPQLSDEANRELFGKCNYPNGHGHNYVLEVTVAGPVSERSGRVIEPGILDQIVNREVVERYDHRHLNYDLEDFSGVVPSAEIITRVIWERLSSHIPDPSKLYRVLLRETARNIFEYYGETEVKR